jgi:hypothetical protein
MLTYEQFVAVLLGSLERQRVSVAYTQELIDTHALGRSLAVTCLPDGLADQLRPQEPALRAVITVRWPPEFTIFSLRGSATLPIIDNLVDDRLIQSASGTALDVDLCFHLPPPGDVGPAGVGSGELGLALLGLCREALDGDDDVQVEAETVMRAGQLRVEAVRIRRTYAVDDALYDLELLEATFQVLSEELRAVLARLAGHIGPLPRDSEPISDSLRRYLRPPTA